MDPRMKTAAWDASLHVAVDDAHEVVATVEVVPAQLLNGAAVNCFSVAPMRQVVATDEKAEVLDLF